MLLKYWVSQKLLDKYQQCNLGKIFRVYRFLIKCAFIFLPIEFLRTKQDKKEVIFCSL